MRKINELIVHASYTKPTMDIGAAEIRTWHTDPRSAGGRGWSDIGYHDVIRRNGVIEPGRPIETPGAHAKGHNDNSIGVCLIGGMDKSGKPFFNFTSHQMDALRLYVHQKRILFPKIIVKGHNEVSSKPCPCFNVSAYFEL